MTESLRTIACKPASAGRAEGRPVVVRTVADLVLVQDGDILVASETEIAFVPAMLRAAAVITEQGGRFCHAAVWARENSKPVVLQAEDATSLLSGIARVVVDADAGIICWETSDGG